MATTTRPRSASEPNLMKREPLLGKDGGKDGLPNSERAASLHTRADSVARKRIGDSPQDPRNRNREVKNVGAQVPLESRTSTSAVDVTVPVGDLDDPLPATARKVEDTVVRITSDPESPTVLQLKKDNPPKAPVALYNAYTSNGEKKGHYFDLKAKHHDQLQDTFHLVKNYCLKDGVIPEDATGFTISFRTMQVRYYDPATDNICIRSLNEIMDADPDVKVSVEKSIELIKTKINKGEICSKMEDHCKGAADGASPCYRSNAVLANQPKSTGAESYKKALEIAQPVLRDDTQIDRAIHRMGKAETIIKRTKDKIAEEKLKLTTQFQTAVDPTAQNQIRRKIQELQAVEQRLEQLDTFAIYSALAFYPDDAVPSLATVSRNAELLQNAMSSKLEQERQQAIDDGTARKWIPKSFPLLNRLRKPPEIEKSDSYAVDAAGLMFSGLETLEARAGYNDFCRAHHENSKKDGLEDAIVREVLRPQSLENGENPVLERLFEGISDPTIKRSLADERGAAINDAHDPSRQFPMPATSTPSARVDSYRGQANLLP
ncbi:MAG: hypothetical protein JSR93_08510 [Verrucomicrobia bacterium]|nr:hypothetical protein [Verrucomicrobiota bacterium]